MNAKIKYIGKELDVIYELEPRMSDSCDHKGEHLQSTDMFKSVLMVQNIPFHDFNQGFIHDLEFVLNDVKKVDLMELM